MVDCGTLLLLVAIFYFLGLLSISTAFSATRRAHSPPTRLSPQPERSALFVRVLGEIRSFISFSVCRRSLKHHPGCHNTPARIGVLFSRLFRILLAVGAVFVVADTWTLPAPAYAEFAVLPIWLIASSAGLRWPLIGR